MTRQKITDRPASGLSSAELGDFLRAEPPAFLDELVRQRMGRVLEQRRAPALPVRTAQAETFGLGFLAYGAQLADGVARMLWRALRGQRLADASGSGLIPRARRAAPDDNDNCFY